jgi:hypothetical protein
MDVKQLRPDWQLAKVLNRDHGLKAARQWMRAPLVDLRGNVNIAQAETIDSVGRRILADPTEARERADWEMLPWLDAVYLGDFDESLFAMRVVEVEPTTEEGEGTQAGEFCRSAGLPCESEWFVQPGERTITHVCTLYLLVVGSPEWSRTATIAIDTTQLPARGVAINLPDSIMAQRRGHAPHEFANESLRVTMTLASMCIVFVQECDEHFVEVRPEPKARTEKQQRKDSKTVSKFPWLRVGAPRIIALDGAKHYPEHGREHGGGTHASPIPHQRKGHWREYRHERFKHVRGQRVWVRPMWIGPKEWVHLGSVYRVLDLDDKGKA